jgi:hypothetical protein
MAKFEALDPNQIRRLEKEALEKYVQKKGDGKKLLPGVVLRIRAIFPFQLFPDELLIKKDTITLITRLGPGMNQERTIHFDDVAQVEADLGPIFAHLHVYPKLRTEESLIIDRISRKDALLAERTIEERIEEEHKKHESSY